MKSILLIAIATLACSVSSMSQNFPSYVPTDGLVGWWPFNGNANDESANGNNGTVNGAVLTADRFGLTNTAYSFDGVNDYITIDNSNTISIQTNFSFSVWIYMDGGSCNPRVFEINEQINSCGGYALFANGTSNQSRSLISTFGSCSGGIAYGWNQQNENFITSLEWHNISVSVDGTNSTLRYYIDGNLIQENYASPIPVFSYNGNNLTIGNINPGRCDWWGGKIDDFGIWNRALTPQEISALYSATNTTNNNQTSNTTANVPGAISYQAIARDAQGAPLADTNVQVRFTLLADSLSGAEEYVETHNLSTNSLGLFTTAFGAGTPVSNTFENINWSAGNKYLNVQVDTGNGLVDMGTQQLLSTPYSLYSAKAGEIKNPGLPVFSDNTAALAGGLVAGDMYRTSTGDLKIVY